MNPDAYTGADAPVFAHFGFVGSPESAFVSDARAAAQAGPPEPVDQRARAIARICAHPVFGDARVLSVCAPEAPGDQGALTELFFLRHMRALYEAPATSVRESELRGSLASIVPSPDRLDRWWHLTGAAFADPARLLAAVDPATLLDRCQRRFARLVEHGPTPADRYRSIAYWFLRESLLFGSASHPTIFMDRRAALDVADGCIVGIHATSPGSTLSDAFENLFQRLAGLLDHHREHVWPWGDRLYLMGRERRDAYLRACRSLLD